MSDTATIDQTETAQKAKPAPKARPKAKDKPKVEQPKMWNVVLHDDDDHSFEYVVIMLFKLFAKPFHVGLKMAEQVHTQGRVICETTHKERAEFKRDQIHSYGPDHRIARCKGSMTATIEPAEGGDDDDDGEGKG